MIRVSEVVTIEEIEKWKQGDIITISAGTGAGKSYFIKNILYAIAKRDNKKILFLIHRKNCFTQFDMELRKDNKVDIIDIKTYQSLESLLKGFKDVDLSKYGYLVLDEFHYFIGDASFSKYTDLSFNLILEATHATRIFMSATGAYVKRYINKVKGIPTTHYEIPRDFSHIRTLEFYNYDDTIYNYIEESIKTKTKTIVFIDEATRAYELYNKYKEYSFFNCGANNEHYKYVDQDKINLMLQNEKFDDLILFTTAVMDAGVNINDKEVGSIICEIRDIASLVQCVGRKRVQSKDDYIDLKIKTISGNRLGGMETQTKKKLERVDDFKNMHIEDYLAKYYRQKDDYGIIYDESVLGGYEKKINDMMYFKCQMDLEFIERVKDLGEFGYCKFVADYFKKPYRIVEMENKIMELKDYLDSIVGKMLFKNEREELVQVICLKDKNGRIQKGIDTLNAYLYENGFDYKITSHTDSRRKLSDGSENTNRNRIYWSVN